MALGLLGPRHSDIDPAKVSAGVMVRTTFSGMVSIFPGRRNWQPVGGAPMLEVELKKHHKDKLIIFSQAEMDKVSLKMRPLTEGMSSAFDIQDYGLSLVAFSIVETLTELAPPAANFLMTHLMRLHENAVEAIDAANRTKDPAADDVDFRNVNKDTLEQYGGDTIHKDFLADFTDALVTMATNLGLKYNALANKAEVAKDNSLKAMHDLLNKEELRTLNMTLWQHVVADQAKPGPTPELQTIPKKSAAANSSNTGTDTDAKEADDIKMAEKDDGFAAFDSDDEGAETDSVPNRERSVDKLRIALVQYVRANPGNIWTETHDMLLQCVLSSIPKEAREPYDPKAITDHFCAHLPLDNKTLFTKVHRVTMRTIIHAPFLDAAAVTRILTGVSSFASESLAKNLPKSHRSIYKEFKNMGTSDAEAMRFWHGPADGPARIALTEVIGGSPKTQFIDHALVATNKSMAKALVAIPDDDTDKMARLLGLAIASMSLLTNLIRFGCLSAIRVCALCIS